MRWFAIGGAAGANFAAFAAGVGGNLDRSASWMAVCALFTIAAAVRTRR